MDTDDEDDTTEATAVEYTVTSEDISLVVDEAVVAVGDKLTAGCSSTSIKLISLFASHKESLLLFVSSEVSSPAPSISRLSMLLSFSDSDSGLDLCVLSSFSKLFCLSSSRLNILFGKVDDEGRLLVLCSWLPLASIELAADVSVVSPSILRCSDTRSLTVSSMLIDCCLARTIVSLIVERSPEKGEGEEEEEAVDEAQTKMEGEDEEGVELDVDAAGLSSKELRHW